MRKKGKEVVGVDGNQDLVVRVGKENFFYGLLSSVCIGISTFISLCCVKYEIYEEKTTKFVFFSFPQNKFLIMVPNNNKKSVNM